MAVLFKLVLVCFATVSSEILDHRFFLGQIIEKYGYNGTISYEGFERLYKNLGLGNATAEGERNSRLALANRTSEDARLTRTGRGVTNSSREYKEQEELVRLLSQHDEVSIDLGSPILQRCLSTQELLAIYGLPGHAHTLSPVSFLHLCPAIVYELDQRTCVGDSSGNDGGRHQHVTIRGSTHSSWLFACLTVFLISVSGLLTVAVVPMFHKSLVDQLVSFLVALAVGTLLGDAFLHLIPHALETHGAEDGDSHKDSIMKTGLMFLTVIFFFMFEAVLNVVRTEKEKHRIRDNLSYVSVNINQNEKEMMEIGNAHQHSHSHTPHNNIALMVVMGDGLHNVTDGLAIGAAFSGGLAAGFATALAVFTHELPHELGDFAVLLQSGMTVRKALHYNVLSSVLSFFGTVVGLVIGNFGDYTQWIYAVTAGSFIYIALSNLVPEIKQQKSSIGNIILRLFGILCGGALMGCIALYEHDIQLLFL